MAVSFWILAFLTLASAVAAMTMARLIHCALALVLAFAGVATLYLNLGAEFAGLAQLLVYVGAVAILIVFAILLTRSSEVTAMPAARTAFSGSLIALAVFAVLARAIISSRLVHAAPAQPIAPMATVRQIGEALMQPYVLPLEVLALLLTAALIGAVLIALREKPSKQGAPTS
ncbi:MULTISPECIES: NADH-quinone oxidoreductase subunit J [Acidobacterium]|uniref:NADH-quinone oxidoreductase subunit J n=2 Tax=Acidobacterium capsulatum TaxID=33075 RepID=C1F218_ACIC5|nr:MULTISPECIES: NADH-quinone oxidoreductase subunit J [Acidobacterium]ACO33750.1 NADH dehydrogenase subunit J [Acidobacterium capsulatum ATCC 51196]HCT61298.1 NADH-quinone oxidoreductase subunit J [Acidobacterium sp.]